jgi:hypothetical protein
LEFSSLALFAFPGYMQNRRGTAAQTVRHAVVSKRAEYLLATRCALLSGSSSRICGKPARDPGRLRSHFAMAIGSGFVNAAKIIMRNIRLGVPGTNATD